MGKPHAGICEGSTSTGKVEVVLLDSDKILFEQPLGERYRIFLRLDYLFQQIHDSMHEAQTSGTHPILCKLAELLTLLERPDLKSELFKELSEQQKSLSRFNTQENVDFAKLDKLIKTLKTHEQLLNNLPNKFTQSFKTLEPINSVKQRLLIPGGTCNFDLPHYHFWLHTPLENQLNELNQWLLPLTPIEDALNFVLQITRDLGIFKPQTTNNGYFQHMLEQGAAPLKLIQVMVSAKQNLYPEISGNKHCINVRFLTPSANERGSPFTGKVSFDLAIC